MSFNRISAAEAASLIKHGYNIGLSGFTPAGTAKAVTAELAKIAEAEHAKGNPFQVGIFTGASTGESCDGILSRAKAIRYRAPYTTNADFRKAVNLRSDSRRKDLSDCRRWYFADYLPSCRPDYRGVEQRTQQIRHGYARRIRTARPALPPRNTDLQTE